MKKIPTFLAGMFTTALIGSLGVTTLAATGQLTISVAPINIQVNGQTFQPKDAQGNSVPVFAYNGTTYAPLRALADAYGLEVGYDAERNMATVGGSGGAATPVVTSAPVTPPLPYAEDNYELLESWTLVVNGTRYECRRAVCKGSTYYEVTTLTTSLPAELLSDFVDAVSNAATITIAESQYVCMRDISSFFDTHASENYLNPETKEHMIYYES